MTEYKRNGSCVEAFIYDFSSRKRLLLIQRAQEPFKGCWGLPGGFVEFGEHPTDAIIREVEEETGRVIMHPHLCGFYMEQVEDDHRQIAIYKVGLDDTRDYSDFWKAFLKSNEEVLDIRWFDMVDLPLNLVPGFSSRMSFLINMI